MLKGKKFDAFTLMRNLCMHIQRLCMSIQRLWMEIALRLLDY